MKDGGRYLILLVAVAVFLISMADAALIEVGPGQSIQMAIDEASSGDTIDVLGGIYRESLDITKPIILKSDENALLDSEAIGNGITLRVDGVSISGFDIKTARKTGIQILSGENIIKNNTISGCLDGIRLDRALHNSIVFNDINNNTNGIAIYASMQNIIENNDIKDNNINEESDCGIFLAYSHENTIRRNNLSENGDCSISLRSSSGNQILGNNVSHNDWYGISLAEDSDENLIRENNVSDNKDAGIYLDDSRKNSIQENKAAKNAKGIYLAYDSNDNSLEGNIVSNNEKGLCLANHSGNNTVVDNMAQENGYGIYLSFSAGWNLLFGNRLIHNGYNAYDMGRNNAWDNGTIGNYYSDLGRIFYVPGGKSVDKYPLKVERES